MNDHPDQHEIDEVFSEAIELAPEQREVFLKTRCQGLHPETSERVRALITADEEAGERSLYKPVINIADSVTLTETSQNNDPLDTRVGPYRLLQQIGEGGMGLVYMADQTSPVRRQVALKLIKPGMDSKLVSARFEAERQALAMMDHPNIAKVLDGGQTDDGRLYFAMELVKGTAINKYCDERRLSLEKRLELFLSVCLAVQHAHQKGVIHRDLKPSNILVAEYDSDPVAKVIDFGLAKALQQPLTDRTLFTHFGQIVGTYEYMSPEQAKMNQLDIDTRTDIYSLGVLLYELTAGVPPFDRQTLRTAAFDEMLRIIREVEPPRPSTRLVTNDSSAEIASQRCTEPQQLFQKVRGDLDAIVMKALEKERSQRYQTCSDLAEDIRHFLADEPVTATPPSSWQQLNRFARRYRALAIGTTVTALGLLAAALISSVFWWRANYLANDLTDQLTISRINMLCWQSKDLQRTEPFLSSLLAMAAVDVGKEELGRVLPVTHERLINASIHLPQPAIGIGNPEGSRALKRNGRWICAKTDNQWKVFDIESKDPFRQPYVLPGSEHLHVANDGQTFYTDGKDATSLLQWRRGITTPAELACDLPPMTSFAVSENEEWLAFAFWDGTIRVRRLTPDSNIDLVFPHGEGADVKFLLEISRDNRWLIGHKTQFWGNDEKAVEHFGGQKVYLWDLTGDEFNMTPIELHFDETRGLSHVSTSEDGEWLITGCFKGFTRIWDLRPDDPSTSLLNQLGAEVNHSGRCSDWAATKDRRRIATASVYAQIWDLDSNDVPQLTHTFSENREPMRSIDMTPDGRWVVSGGHDSIIRVWDLDANAPAQSEVMLQGHEGDVWDVAISANGRWVVSQGNRNDVRLWDLQEIRDHGESKILAEGPDRRAEKPEEFVIWDTDVSSDNRLLAAARKAGDVRIWDISPSLSSPAAEVLGANLGVMSSVSISPDSKSVLAAGVEGVWLWKSTEAGWENIHLRTAKDFDPDAMGQLPDQCEISPTGRWAVAGDQYDGSCWIWDLESNDPAESPFVLSYGNAGCDHVAFSRNGRWLATANSWNTLDSRVFLWDFSSLPSKRPEPVVLDAHTQGEITVVQFAGGRDSLITADTAGKILEWNVESISPRLARTIQEEGPWIWKLAVSKNNRWLASLPNQQLALYDLRGANTPEPITLTDSETDKLFSVRISPNSRWLAAGAHDGQIYVWDLEAESIASSQRILTGHDRLVNTLTFTPDSMQLISSGASGRLIMWPIDLDYLRQFTMTSVGRNLSEEERLRFEIPSR